MLLLMDPMQTVKTHESAWPTISKKFDPRNKSWISSPRFDNLGI